MRGALILTEGRSGSNWLGSLTNSTGKLGKSSEWIDRAISGIDPRKFSCEEFVDSTLKLASTENGFFSVKLFPRHMHQFQEYYGKDLIKCISASHDVLLVGLTRRDRVGQAISFSKALQTGAWKATTGSKHTPIYDFGQICRCYFMVSRSYDFWASYTNITQSKVVSFIYEDLLADPTVWVDEIAEFAGITYSKKHITPTTQIQRNLQSETWRDQFLREIGSSEFIAHTSPSRTPSRNAGNLVRFARGHHMKPKPYSS